MCLAYFVTNIAGSGLVPVSILSNQARRPGGRYHIMYEGRRYRHRVTARQKSRVTQSWKMFSLESSLRFFAFLIVEQ